MLRTRAAAKRCARLWRQLWRLQWREWRRRRHRLGLCLGPTGSWSATFACVAHVPIVLPNAELPCNSEGGPKGEVRSEKTK